MFCNSDPHALISRVSDSIILCMFRGEKLLLDMLLQFLKQASLTHDIKHILIRLLLAGLA